jgi:hypothetical protein
LGALIRQRFEASNVHGEGISMRLRQRLRAAPTSPEEVATLPPIEGLPPYTMRPPETPWPGMWNDAYYNLWSARLEGIVAKDVREVWIDHTRFEGSVRIDGRFYLKPLRAVEVGPARVDVARGGVYTGETPVAERLDGSVLDATVGRFDPRTAAGQDILHGLSISVDAHALLPELARAPLSLPAGMTVRGPAEIRRAQLRVSSGVLQSEGHLDLVAPGVIGTSGESRTTGSLALRMDVAASPAGGPDRLALHVEMDDVEISQVPGRSGTLRAPRLTAVGDSTALDLARPLEDLHFVVEMPQGTMAAASDLSRYIPPKTPVAIVKGQAQVSARIEGWLAERRIAGRGTVRSEDLDVRLAKMDVRGRMSLDGAFGSYQFDTRRLEHGSLAIVLAQGSLSSATHPDQAVVRVRNARLDAFGPVVDLADPLSELRVTLSMPDSEVLSGKLLEPYLPKGAGMPTGSGRAPFSLQGHLVIVQHLARGSLEVLSKELHLDYGPMRLRAGLGVRAQVRDWHWETGDLALHDARAEMQNVVISDSRSTDRSAPPAMTVARIAVDAKSPRFQLDKPLALVTLSLQVADATVHDSSAVNAMLPEHASFALDADGGHFETRLAATVEDRVAWGTARIAGTNIGAGGSVLRLRGDVELMADFAGWNLQRNVIAWLDSRLTITHAAGRFLVPGPPQLTADRVLLLTRKPNFELARPSLKGADFHVVVDGAALPAAALTPLLSNDGSIGIASGAATGAADLRVSSSQGTARGGIDVDVDRGGVWLGQKYFSGDLRLRGRVSGFDPESEVLDVTGSRLEMRDVAVSGASAATTGWQGDVVLALASVRVARDPLFDGVVGLKARDARPILAMAFGDSLPRFVVGLIAMPGLRASTRAVVAPHQLALLDLDARGGNVAVRGSYAARDGSRRGAIVARKAFLSIGIRLDDEGARLRLFGLQRWLREQTHDVRKLLEVQGEPAR